MPEKPKHTENEPQPKPKRLLVLNPDGTVHYLDGKGLERFVGVINALLTYTDATQPHRLIGLDDIKWKKADQSDTESLLQAHVNVLQYFTKNHTKPPILVKDETFYHPKPRKLTHDLDEE